MDKWNKQIEDDFQNILDSVRTHIENEKDRGWTTTVVFCYTKATSHYDRRIKM